MRPIAAEMSGKLPAPCGEPPLLAASTPRVRAAGIAWAYAESLLASLGAKPKREADAGPAIPPALAWARSGAMALTGLAGGPPRLAPAPLASCMEGAWAALLSVAGSRRMERLDATALLGERAALAGLERRGRIAPGGSARLLRAADGWIAVNLARAEDRELVPAWLGAGSYADLWRSIEARVRCWKAAEAVARARLLGLAAAVAEPPPSRRPPWVRLVAQGRAKPVRSRAAPLVLDLSALWAGPLCAHLLGQFGARVIKVESRGRPDGARRGPRPFFDLLNAGKESVALDLPEPHAIETLRALLRAADIVIESSRPRALQQLGIDPEEIVRGQPGLTWVSITGYGRSDPAGRWIAFGDDAAVAAGLAVATGRGLGHPIFCGDAIADPLTGLHAALAAAASWRAGGGHLLELSLRNVTAHALGFAPGSERGEVRALADGWEVAAGGLRARVEPPRARPVRRRAAALGLHTEAVVAELVRPC